jgi:hypothetical protein
VGLNESREAHVSRALCRETVEILMTKKRDRKSTPTGKADKPDQQVEPETFDASQGDPEALSEIRSVLLEVIENAPGEQGGTDILEVEEPSSDELEEIEEEEGLVDTERAAPLGCTCEKLDGCRYWNHTRRYGFLLNKRLPFTSWICRRA